MLKFQAKPNCLVFLDNDTVVVGGESKEAQVGYQTIFYQYMNLTQFAARFIV